MTEYILYVADVESTGLSSVDCDIIELSLCRMTDKVQKTWFLKAINEKAIEEVALKINGHKLEDITHKTQIGKEKYKDPNDVIIEIENFLMEDGLSADNRYLVGQNISFDKEMMTALWAKNNSKETFPFGRRTISTDMIEFFINYIDGKLADNYSLNGLCKIYGVKNLKQHSAEFDVIATTSVFEKQVETMKKRLNKNI